MTDVLNSIPCKLKYTGPAKITKYFNCNQEIQQNDKNVTASFRGKHVIGTSVEFPDGYSMNAVKKSTDKINIGNELLDNAEQNLENLGRVKKLVYWNYDNAPSNKDPIAKAVAWVKIADKLFNSDS